MDLLNPLNPLSPLNPNNPNNPNNPIHHTQQLTMNNDPVRQGSGSDMPDEVLFGILGFVVLLGYVLYRAMTR